MPTCCGRVVITSQMPNNAIRVNVSVLKENLDEINSYWKSTPSHPLQLDGKLYQKGTIQFRSLEVRLDVSTGKFAGYAVFARIDPSPSLVQSNWLQFQRLLFGES